MPFRPVRLLIPLLLLATPALATDEGSGTKLARHRIDLRIGPGEWSGVDRIELPYQRKLELLLDPGLQLRAARCGELDLLQRLRAPRGAEEGSGRRQVRLPRECKDEEGRASMELEYAGSLGELEHGRRIAPELSLPSTYELRVDAPATWVIDAPGRFVATSEAPAVGRALFAMELEAPTLRAGPWAARERRSDGRLLRCVLRRPDDEALAARLLDATEAALGELEKIRGPFPGSRIDFFEQPAGFSRAQLERLAAPAGRRELKLRLLAGWDGGSAPSGSDEGLGMGLPRLSLEGVSESEGSVSGRILQEGPALELRPEILVTTVDGRTLRERIPLEGPVTEWSFEIRGPVREVELDPDAEWPQPVTDEELPPTLARTLDAKRLGHELIIAHPLAPADPTPEIKARAEAFLEVAKALAAETGGEPVPAVLVAEGEWNASSFVLLGGPEDNPITARLADRFLEAGLDVTGPGFRAGDRRWLEPGDSLVASIDHPDRAGAGVSVWVPNGEDALRAGREALAQRDDTWVALRDGQVAERSAAEPDRSALRVVLREPAPASTTEERLRASVAALLRPEFEGRGAGSAGSRRAAERIADELREAGLAGWDPRGFEHLFAWLLRDLPRQPILFVERPDRTRSAFACTPLPYWLPVPPQFMEDTGHLELADPPIDQPILIPISEGLVWAGTLDEPAFRGLDLRGAAALVLDDAALPPADEPEARARHQAERLERYFELLEVVRRHEGETLIVIRPQDEPPFLPALAAYPSLDHERDAELAAALERDGTLGVLRAASARHARVGAPTVPVRLALAGRDLLEALEADGPPEPGRRWWRGTYLDLRLRIRTERRFDRNLVGLTQGAMRLSDGVILVGAPHDGRGWATDGRFRRDAPREAAATAALLELARRLAEDPPALTVAFASYGAGRWGRVGESSLVNAWPGHWPVRAAFDLEGAGDPTAPLRIVGGAAAPELVEALAAAAGVRGLQLELDDGPASSLPWAATGAPELILDQGSGGAGEDAGLEDVDFEELARVVDVLEAAIRRLAAGADS